MCKIFCDIVLHIPFFKICLKKNNIRIWVIFSNIKGSQNVRLLIWFFIKGLWIRNRLRLTAKKTVNWSAVCLNVYIKLASLRVPSQRTDSRPALVFFRVFLAQSNTDPSSAADRQNSTIADKQSRWRRKTDVRAKAGSSIALHGFNISTKRVYGSQLERFRSPLPM